jgi:multiple antibiotic resistance protein
MWRERLTEFVTLWVIIDPLGSLSVYLAVTAGLDPKMRQKIAFLSVGVAFLMLLFFVVAGQVLLIAMGIGLNSFQIAGGIVLFLFALQLVFGTLSQKPAQTKTGGSLDLAVFPLGTPSIAGPGAMLAAVLLTDNDRYAIHEQALTVAVMAVVLVLTLILFLLAEPVARLIGKSGASVISRIMGMLLAAVAVDMVLKALTAWLRLPPL